jgi:hypothetical protein
MGSPIAVNNHLLPGHSMRPRKKTPARSLETSTTLLVPLTHVGILCSPHIRFVFRRASALAQTPDAIYES